MDNIVSFEIDEVVPLSDGIVVVLTMVEDEDEEVFAPIEAARCPSCGDMVKDFRKHRCYW